MKPLVLIFLLAGQSSSQSFGKSLSKVSDAANGLSHLRQLISQAEDEDLRGKVSRISYPLPTPRPQYTIGSSDLEYYLSHSLLAVCDPQTMESNQCFCQGKFILGKSFKNSTLDSQAAVAVDPRNKLVVVSYRATVTEINWQTNEDAQLVGYPNLDAKIKVHRGHLRHFLSIHHQTEPVVLQYLRDPRFSGYTLHVTGFSLGASVSAISLPTWQSALKAQHLQNRIQMFTYDGPRPGNLEFSLYLETMNIPLIRYVKQGDVVPHLPDQSMGFSQVGQEYYDVSTLTLKKELIRCSPYVVEDDKCSLRDSSFRAIHHITPFQTQRPKPPFC